MIEKRLRVRDIQTIMGCSRQSATRYMRQMVHAENPLTVKEEDFIQWEQRRTIDPTKAPTPCPWTHKGTNRVVKADDWRVPRRREAK